MTYVQAVITVYLLCVYMPTESAGSLTKKLPDLLARRLAEVRQYGQRVGKDATPVVRDTVDQFENMFREFQSDITSLLTYMDHSIGAMIESLEQTMSSQEMVIAELTEQLSRFEQGQGNQMCGDFLIGPVTDELNTRTVNYALASGQQAYSILRACAEASIDNQYLAVRVNEATGDCDPLTWDWGSDPQYETGYAYLRKTNTVESYQPPYNITERFQWLLPGTLGVGGSVDLYITIPSGVNWNAFEIMMLDTTEYGFQTYDGEPEVIMVYIQIERQWNDVASAHFKIWSAGWDNKLFLRSTTLADGNAHKFTFVPNADVMQILIDDEEVVQYEHITDPATAKQISIDPYDIPIVELHSITFEGV